MKIKITRSDIVVSEITIVRCHEDHEIKYIRTAPDHRGKGYASTLLERAKTRFFSLVAFLEDDGTGLTVDQMEAWYKRHGFKKRRYDLGGCWDTNYKQVMYWTRGD